MVGLITRLSLLAKNVTAFKSGKVAKSGNAASAKLTRPFGVETFPFFAKKAGFPSEKVDVS